MKAIVLKHNEPHSEFSLDTSDGRELFEFYVGRSEDCHVQIDDPLISRHHFVIKNDHNKWFCKKLTNLGIVIVNGNSVENAPIKNGDEIKFGAYSMIISDLAGDKVTVPQKIAPIKEDLGVLFEEEKPSFKKEKEPEREIVNNEIIESIKEPITEDFSDQLISTLDESSDNLSLDTPSEEINDDFTEEQSEDHFSTGELPVTSDFNDAPVDENYEVAPVENEQESNTRFFKTFVNYQLVLFGEHAPYDRFEIDQDEIFIGRDAKKCQIVLNDPEVSSLHAVLRKENSIITLEDLNSSNGTILNGERINKATISDGDEFVIGGTSFTLQIKSDLLESESDRLMPVESGQVVETEEIIEEEVTPGENISFDSDAPPEKSIIKRIWKDPVKRKKSIYVLAAAALIWVLFFPEEETEVAKKVKPKDKVENNTTIKVSKCDLSKETKQACSMAYELGISYFEQSRYDMAQIEFQKVSSLDPDYKKVRSYEEQTKLALQKIEELAAQKRAEEDRLRVKKIIDELLVKAREAVKERQVQVAESYFSQIIEKDPENIEVSQLKLELESWQKEEEKKALERALKEAARKKMVDSLSPGKTFYLKKEWYRAILKLEEFLRIKGIDEDLVKEGSDMLSDAKNQLASELGPLLGKARSLKEGQDYKAAYEAYLDTLKVEPTNAEALNEVDDIKAQLDGRSKRIYREAIIAESLSLFSDAKEKFQEVQQISPTDSEYYKKATEKLKNYLE